MGEANPSVSLVSVKLEGDRSSVIIKEEEMKSEGDDEREQRMLVVKEEKEDEQEQHPPAQIETAKVKVEDTSSDSPLTTATAAAATTTSATPIKPEQKKPKKKKNAEEYLKTIGSLLSKLKAQVEVSCGGSAIELPSLPGLCINGVGPVGLPVTEVTAKAIIKVATQAPYGKGRATVVDKVVRDTWEIQPKQVEFLNPEYEAGSCSSSSLLDVCSMHHATRYGCS